VILNVYYNLGKLKNNLTIRKLLLIRKVILIFFSIFIGLNGKFKFLKQYEILNNLMNL
jgi:hypothetical protein